MRTREEWRKTILDDLGGEGVDPDLTENQLDAALARALECWNKYKPHIAWFPFDIPASETVVISFFGEDAQNDPLGHPLTNVNNILNVNFVDRNRRVLGARAGFLEGYYIRWGFQGPRTFFQYHVAERNYERLTGARPDWHWNPDTRQLFITSPSRDTRAMVLASRDLKLEEIRYDHFTDFRRLAVASAKRTLARVLGSRGPIPGVAGVIETDASNLRSEADAEWNNAEEKLMRSLTSFPPIGYVG